MGVISICVCTNVHTSLAFMFIYISEKHTVCMKFRIMWVLIALLGTLSDFAFLAPCRRQSISTACSLFFFLLLFYTHNSLPYVITLSTKHLSLFFVLLCMCIKKQYSVIHDIELFTALHSSAHGSILHRASTLWPAGLLQWLQLLLSSHLNPVAGCWPIGRVTEVCCRPWL
jgi:hypothetical protein